MEPFSPSSLTANINVSSSSQRVLVTNARGVQQVRFANQGSAWVWIAWGDVSTTASISTGMPVGPGVIEVQSFVTPYSGDLYFSVIAAGSTGIISFTPGSGV